MQLFDRLPSDSLEHREMQLIVLACLAIIILAGGLILFMYPVVFSPPATPNHTLTVTFFGFCALSVLLAGYLVERQMTILRLRRQIEEDRRHASDALKRASADLLEALPNFSSFQYRLPMEFKRAVSAKQELSVLVVAIELSAADASDAASAPGDAAKAISRKLREEDSIYVLSPGYFGVILPGIGTAIAQRVCERLSEGLADAAGVAGRYTFRIKTVSYPEQSSSAQDLELAVCGLLPTDGMKPNLMDLNLVSQ